MQPGSRRNVGATRSLHGVFDRYIFSGAPMDNNVYLLVCPRTRDAVLIDASGDAEQLLNEVRQAQARVRMILNIYPLDALRCMRPGKGPRNWPAGTAPFKRGSARCCYRPETGSRRH